MATKLKEQEVRFARAFLHALHGNEKNGYLLLAIIAWMRAESGTTYRGNNPMNLRPGKDIAQWASGVRKAGNNGYFAVFKSLADAAKATAARLLKAGNDYRGYALVVKAARRYSSGGGQVTQAIDFMNALALSKWDAGHYNTTYQVYLPQFGEYVTKTDLSRNSLIKVWVALTGMKIPPSWFTDVVAPPKPPPPPRPSPPRPSQPRSMAHVNPKAEYVQPYAAQRFYNERPHLSEQVYSTVPDVDL